MMNDYAWTTLHAHRESEHRARARRRGGEDNPVRDTRPGLARRLRLAVGRHVAAAHRASAPLAASLVEPTAATPTPVPAMRAAMRRKASDAPTTAALAWARLASGAGSLAPATSSTTERERQAA